MRDHCQKTTVFLPIGRVCNRRQTLKQFRTENRENKRILTNRNLEFTYPVEHLQPITLEAELLLDIPGRGLEVGKGDAPVPYHGRGLVRVRFDDAVGICS